MLRRTVVAVLGMTAFALVGGVTAPQATAEVSTAAVTITYDDSQAAEYADAITQGIAVWNEQLSNVQIDKVAPGQQAEVTFVSDPGWPRAELGPAMPGDGLTIWFGKQAVDEGYDTIRIAAHEFGHSLGLPDIKPGPCSSLMSGSTAGVDCTNPVPNAEEIAMAEDNYASTTVPRQRTAHPIIVG